MHEVPAFGAFLPVLLWLRRVSAYKIDRIVDRICSGAEYVCRSVLEYPEYP